MITAHRFMRAVCLFAFCLILAWPVSLAAERIMVRAVDQLTGEGIPEATLILSNAGRRERSDASGWIQIEVIEPGTFDAFLTAGGYTGRRIRLEISEDVPSLRKEIYLDPLILDLAAFEVEAQLTDEDRDALAKRNAIAPMDQISGEELREITDDDIGDTLEKIAGVTVDSEEGSVTGISIRGAGPKQTRVTVDGQSVAGGGGRGTTRGAQAMGQIPREFLNRIQVMKAPTPDMDADAIGGTVDLQTSRVANSKSARSSLAYRSAYQEEGDTWTHRLNLAHAQPIKLGKGTKRMGILIALNGMKNEFSGDELRVLNQWPFRTSPETGESVQTLARMRVGTRNNKTEGYGLVINTDLKLNKDNNFQLKIMRNQRDLVQSSEFHTFEFIRGNIVSLFPDSGAFEKMRNEKQFFEKTLKDKSGSVVLAGEHKVGQWKIDESIGYSYANNVSLGTENAIFRTLRTYDGSYDISRRPSRPSIAISKDGEVLDNEAFLDPDPYRFTRYDLIDDWADDEEVALRMNAAHTWETDEGKWIFKGGLKARLRDASKDQDKIKYSPVGPPFLLSEISAPGGVSVFRKEYPLGPSWSALAMGERFLANPNDFKFNQEDTDLDSAAGDFSVSESIYATYGMIQKESEKWIIIAGIRLERTDSETKGFETIREVDDDGNRLVEINPVSISDTYDMWFPGFHALYRPNQNWIIRSSLTRTMQRPDFRDLSPSIRVNLDTKRIRSGNPDLKPFDAKAIDIGTDIILNEWGSISLGVFYKRIDDFIVDIEEEISYPEGSNRPEDRFILSRPVNGSPADLLGLEAAWSTALAFLPHPFEGTWLSFNYTLTDSTAAYPGQPGEIIMLPKQVRQTFNLSLRWRYKNWTINLRTRYRGEQLQDLIEPGQDLFVQGFWSHSMNVNYRINDTFSFSLGMANLNKPDRVSYQGEPLHTVATREGSRTLSLGINVKFGSGKLANLFNKREEEADKI
jgi:TonB-dependent receptor